jgi:hydroxymethylbilane synthase
VFIPHVRNPRTKLAGQQPGAMIATGSLRRRSQLLNKWPHLKIVDIRGNLSTRFTKLGESEWSGMILAAAGVKRLGFMGRAGELLGLETMLPAVGQGALAVEIRSDDSRTANLVSRLDHQDTRNAATAERSLLRTLEGGCQVPIGAYGRIQGDPNGIQTLVIDAYVGSLDGRRAVRGTMSGRPDEAEKIGQDLAQKLLQGGATGILEEIRIKERSGDTQV